MKPRAITEEEADLLDRIDGLFVGQLSPSELEAFDLLCEEGVARRAYEGNLGAWMGLATCRQVYITLARSRVRE